jgi:hypothetical protein
VDENVGIGVTSNALILSGMIAATMRDIGYQLIAINEKDGEIIVENQTTKNQYSVRVEQISGIE